MFEDDNIFYYPENLTEKTTYIAGWEWWALLIMAAGTLLSVALVVAMGLVLPIVITFMFALLTLKIGGTSLYGYIVILVNFVFADQTIYFWSAERSINGKTEK